MQTARPRSPLLTGSAPSVVRLCGRYHTGPCEGLSSQSNHTADLTSSSFSSGHLASHCSAQIVSASSRVSFGGV